MSKTLQNSEINLKEPDLNSVYDVLLPQDTIPYAFDVDTNKTDLRDLLNSELSELPGLWSNDPWDHIATFKRAVLESGKIKNSSYSPYQVHNYRSCYWVTSKGAIHQSYDNTDTYKSRLSCGEKLCLRCDKNKRKRRGLEAVKDIKALFTGMPGAPGVLFLTFTLPENIERLPLYDPELEKNLKNKIHGIVRELFGRNTRSNIGVRLSVHAVGSKDVMRDRWHCHVDIIPGEVVKIGDDRQFHWLKPTKVRPGSKNNWIIDLTWLKEKWREALDGLGLIITENLANPQVEFLKYPENENEQDRYYAKLTHKLTYNLRSFAKDFENVFLRSDYKNYKIILRGSNGRVGYWYNLFAGDVADRFLFVRSRTLFRKRGFLSCLKKYESAITLIYPDEAIIKDCHAAVEAEITTTYQKKYNHEKKIFTTMIIESWHWICPITGQKRWAYGDDLKKWKGG